MTIDQAEAIVDEGVPADLIWAGSLVPPASLRVDRETRALLRAESIVDRGEMATVTARLRFRHLTHRVRYQRRGGTWVAMEPGPEDGGESEIVVVDVVAPMADLIEGLWSHHFAVTGTTTTREVGEPGQESSLIELITHPVNGYIDLRGDPLSGPHGLIRLMTRVRNTTEPLVELPEQGGTLAHSMAGCHLIVALDKGRFLSADNPPQFAEDYVARCQNEGSRQFVLGESAKILLVTADSHPGRVA
ncbi:MAG: hypothetical protein ACRDZM_13290 [Acidimicrobiia bacterium]